MSKLPDRGGTTPSIAPHETSIGDYVFEGPHEPGSGAGAGRAGVVVFLDESGRPDAVDHGSDLAEVAARHPGQAYAVLFTDVYPTASAEQAADARDGLVRAVRARIELHGEPDGWWELEQPYGPTPGS